MTGKKERSYVCAFPSCLHHGEKVKASEAVVLGNRRYHWDCAVMKQEIGECVAAYMNCVEDKTIFPIAYKIIKTLVFKNKVPTDFILENIKIHKLYYGQRSVYALYGIRNDFWEKKIGGGIC